MSDTILTELRRRIEAGESIRSIAAAADIPAPVLNRFVNGRRTLTLPTADKLAEYLGLELLQRKPSKRRKTK
jgi:plasmid maintenance system antidote protein VapI